jgi:hypothetical protein
MKPQSLQDIRPHLKEGDIVMVVTNNLSWPKGTILTIHVVKGLRAAKNDSYSGVQYVDSSKVPAYIRSAPLNINLEDYT